MNIRYMHHKTMENTTHLSLQASLLAKSRSMLVIIHKKNQRRVMVVVYLKERHKSAELEVTSQFVMQRS